MPDLHFAAAATTVTVTETVIASVKAAVAAIAMGTRIYTYTKNGWGRSHLPPTHGRGGNLFCVSC